MPAVVTSPPVAELSRPRTVRQPTVVQIQDPNGTGRFSTDDNVLEGPETTIVFLKNKAATWETFASKASSKLEGSWRKQTVLSFDGGGIRGYSSLLILKEIMRCVKEIEEENQVYTSYYPGEYMRPRCSRASQGSNASESEGAQEEEDELCRYLPCHYFDYIGGTSTGGLIAIMLGRLRMGVGQCLREYERFGGDIFGHARWFSLRGPLLSLQAKYDGESIQKAVESIVEQQTPVQQKAVGAGYFGSSNNLCKTIVVSYCWTDDSSTHRYGKEVLNNVAMSDSYHACPTESGPYLFRSYDHWPTPNRQGKKRNIFERNPGPADNIPIWQVAQATTAAPTYFDQITISNKTFGDGGLGTNNPVEEIFWEVSTMHGNDSSVVDLLVSIGTGQADPVPFYNSGPWKIQSFINATKALATDSEKKHEYMEALLENTGLSEHMMYQRFNVQREKGLKNMKLDEWKEKGKYRATKWGIKKREHSTLEKITEITGEYCKQPEVQEEIRKVAKRLVQNRLDRCTVERKWEQWTTGIRYRCTVKKCDKTQKLRSSKDNLKRHIAKVHPDTFRNMSPKEKEKALEELIKKGTCAY